MHTPSHRAPISLEDPDTFWALIHQAKSACAHDMKAMETFILEQLVTLGPESAWNFHHILHAYSSLAYQYGLWDAAGIIKGYGCSDDGFIDFRAWLIAQGKEIYLAALRDPDTLAEIEPYGECCFESLSYVGSDAYEQLTGQSAYPRPGRQVRPKPALCSYRERLGRPSHARHLSGWRSGALKAPPFGHRRPVPPAHPG